MSRDKVQGFLIGLGVGVLFACFLNLEERTPAAKSTGPPKTNSNDYK
jgi:hypothetical protein